MTQIKHTQICSLTPGQFTKVLAVLTVCGSGEHLALLCFSYKIQRTEATVTVLAVSAVTAASVVTATLLKLNPPFPTS